MKIPNIRYVTFTGADNSIKPEHLYHLHDAYEGMEFGILFSESREGQPRYPTRDWIWELLQIDRGIALSAHLCGGSFRRYATESHEYEDQFLHDHFKRIQLNMNWQRVDDLTRQLLRMKIESNPKTQYIIQENKNNRFAYRYFEGLSNVAILFDASGGRGKEIHNLPYPIAGFFCGYAGGLSPENVHRLEGELQPVIRNGSTWIDMESGVRTGEKFDVGKVEDVMEQVGRFWDD